MNQITPEQLVNLLQSNSLIQLIDVREADERAEYHIGGEWIPLNELESKLNTLDKAKQTVVYCRSGGRSAHACLRLMAAGFHDVSNLDGGMLKWQEWHQ